MASTKLHIVFIRQNNLQPMVDRIYSSKCYRKLYLL